jgi:hypothetical protein
MIVADCACPSQASFYDRVSLVRGMWCGAVPVPGPVPGRLACPGRAGREASPAARGTSPGQATTPARPGHPPPS